MTGNLDTTFKSSRSCRSRKINKQTNKQIKQRQTTTKTKNKTKDKKQTTHIDAVLVPFFD